MMTLTELEKKMPELQKLNYSIRAYLNRNNINYKRPLFGEENH